MLPAMTSYATATWASLLKAKRAERGLSQVELARMIGVSRQAVSMWESPAASAWPKPDHVSRLVAALEINDAELADLYRGGDQEPVGGAA